MSKTIRSLALGALALGAAACTQLGTEDRALVERPIGLEGWTVDRRPLKP